MAKIVVIDIMRLQYLTMLRRESKSLDFLALEKFALIRLDA